MSKRSPEKKSDETTKIPETDEKTAEPKKKKAKAIKKKPVEFVVRDIIVPVKLDEDDEHIKIITYNVAGLRGLLKNKPNVIKDLVEKNNPDILCLQETKLQENHVNDFRDMLSDEGFSSYWSCSVDKKGYSGTAIFVKNGGKNSGEVAPKPKQKKLTSFFAKPSGDKPKEEESNKIKDSINSNPHVNPIEVIYEFTEKKFRGEGRTITIEFESFFLVACYVPNSGQNLERLDYRTQEWDPNMRKYLSSLETKKPVIFTGDLNVGHLDLDIHNPDAKHIVKQSGLTPVERASHTTLLEETGFKDVLRYFYPTARGQFTYWSMRTSARQPNKGIRLDYFICSPSILPEIEINESSTITKTADTDEKEDIDEEQAPPISSEKFRSSIIGPSKDSRLEVVDQYSLHEDTIGSSDHCPVMLTMKFKK